MRPATLPSFLPRLARLLVVLWLGVQGPVEAQGVELGTLELRQTEGALTLEFSARLTLSRQLEDALRRGVPMCSRTGAAVPSRAGIGATSGVRACRAAIACRTTADGELARRAGRAGAKLPGHGGRWPSSRAERMAPGRRAQLEPGERYYVEFAHRL
jgi:hypothetical protein